MASALPTRIDLLDAVRDDLKSKGRKFVFGNELKDSRKSCLVDLLRNQYDELNADVLSQIDTHTDRFINKAPYYWQEGHRKRDAVLEKHTDFWQAEIILAKPDPRPEIAPLELVPYETASVSTQNRRKRKLCDKTAPSLLKEGTIRQLRAEGDQAGADLLQQIIAPREGQMSASEIHYIFYNPYIRYIYNSL